MTAVVLEGGRDMMRVESEEAISIGAMRWTIGGGGGGGGGDQEQALLRRACVFPRSLACCYQNRNCLAGERAHLPGSGPLARHRITRV